MDYKEENAAKALLGKTLKNKWLVIEKLEIPNGESGGFFSVCYIVQFENTKYFLKALNFQAFFNAFNGGNLRLTELINLHTAAFEFERNLLLRCKNNKLSKISLLIDEGEEYYDEYVWRHVPFMVFELADGNVRKHLNFSANIDTTWKLKSLRDIAVGLQQLHYIKVGHQDLKPSNVLVFENGYTSKIGDLGRSLCIDIKAPHGENGQFTGQTDYTPLEYLYGYLEIDKNKRMKSTDLYLLGNLITFYFIGGNITALILKNIDPIFHFQNWNGSYLEVKDYILDAFYKALNEFKASLKNQALANELAKIIEYCCYPFPEKRGHPKSLSIYQNNYDLHRIVSTLDLLRNKSEVSIFK